MAENTENAWVLLFLPSHFSFIPFFLPPSGTSVRSRDNRLCSCPLEANLYEAIELEQSGKR